MIILDDNEDVIENTTSIKTIESEVKALQYDVSTLYEDTQAIESSVNNINKNINDKFESMEDRVIEGYESAIGDLEDSLASTVTTNGVIASEVAADVLNASGISGKTITANESISTPNINVTNQADISTLSATSGTIETFNSTTSTIDTVNATNLNIDNFNIDSLTVDNLTVNSEGKITNLESDLAKISKVVSKLITNNLSWNAPTQDPDNTELIKMTIPFYKGVVVVNTLDKVFGLTILNNALVSYNENEEIIYRIETKPDETVIYFDERNFTYNAITIGESKNLSITTEIVSRVGIKKNTNDVIGVYLNGNTSSGSGSKVEVVSNLPESGEEGTIYIVKNDRSYYYNGIRFVPLSLSIDITSGNTTKGSINENLIYPAVQYSIDGDEAFPGTFYDTSLMISDQVPTDGKLAYLYNDKIKFCALGGLSGTRYGKKENVLSNKEWFENIEWITSTAPETITIPDISAFTLESEGAIGRYSAIYTNDFNSGKVVATVDGIAVNESLVWDSEYNQFQINKFLKGEVDSEGNVTPDEDGNILQFAVFVTGKDVQITVCATNITTGPYVSSVSINGSVISNGIVGEINLADFEYTTPAITISDDNGNSALVATQKVQSYVDYKQNAINSILDERSAYNNYYVEDTMNILSEVIDFSSIVVLP